jgi:hypothetical protein
MWKETSLVQKARRLAGCFNCIVRKSRGRNDVDNRGGYMIVNRDTGFPVFGFWHELSPEALIEYFTT